MGMDMASMVGDVIPELVLLSGAVVVLLLALVLPPSRQAWVAGPALIALVVAAIVTMALLGGVDRLTFAGTYAVDTAALWAKLIILAGTATVVLLSVPWFRQDPRHGEYYALLLLAALGAILMAGATDLKEVLVAILLSSVTGFVLAGYHRRSSLSSEAAIKFYLVGALSNTAALLGAALLFGLAGSTTLAGIADGLAAGGLATEPALVVGLVLLLGVLAFKVGAVPVHSWVPDVAQGAPAPVAGFITAIPKVGAFLFLARLVTALPEDLGWQPLIALAAAATMTLGNLASLWQDDVRRILGWSAVSQTGYGLMAIVGLGVSPLALPALLYFLVAYVAGNIAAFGVIVELRGRTALADFDGIGRARPGLLGAFAVSFLSFIGVPPLAGFVAKLLLFAVAIEVGYLWLAVVAAVNTVVSIVYYVRVLAPAYFRIPAGPVATLARPAAIATYAATAAVIAVGVLSEPFVAAFSGRPLLP